MRSIARCEGIRALLQNIVDVLLFLMGKVFDCKVGVYRSAASSCDNLIQKDRALLADSPTRWEGAVLEPCLKIT